MTNSPDPLPPINAPPAKPWFPLALLAGALVVWAGLFAPGAYLEMSTDQPRHDYRKPLIIMTPKSLLRHPMAKSSAAEFTEQSHFKRILSDRMEIADDKVRRLVLCSGKVAYDLMETREKERLQDVSIVRLEQLYPFPGEPLAARLKKMTNLEDVVWCQEEPRNNGAWFFVESQIEQALAEAGHGGMRPSYAGRDADASPATGFAKKHAEQQAALVDIALGLADGGDEQRQALKRNPKKPS